MHQHRFETLQPANHVICDWIRFYHQRRPRQSLKIKTQLKHTH